MSSPIGQNPYAPPAAHVEDVARGDSFELAGRGSRLGAVIIDGLIQGGLYWGLVATLVPGLKPDPRNVLGAGYFVQTLVVGVLLFLVLQGYLLVTSGQTIGKKLLALRIVRTDGSRVGPGRIIGLRYLLAYVLVLIPFVGGLYALVDALLIFRGSRKCLHDNIADTIVVKA